MRGLRLIEVGFGDEVYVTGWITNNSAGHYDYKSMVIARLVNGALSGSASLLPNGVDMVGTNLVMGRADGGMYAVGYENGVLPSGGFRSFATRLEAGPPTFRYINRINSTAASDYMSNFYAVGHTRGALDGNQNLGGSDVFIIHYDSVGTKQ